MNEYLERLNDPRMDHYKKVYKKSKKWDGIFNLNGKTVITYCEQGYGDCIQFARYFPYLKRLGCRLIAACPKELHRLFKAQSKIDDVLDKESADLPDHDFHVLSMSLPFLLKKTDMTFQKKPYIFVNEKVDLGELSKYHKIGIAWEGNPEHTNNMERSCPVKYFRSLESEKNKLFMLNNEAHLPELIDEEIELYSTEIEDFYDTAKLINSMDVIVTVDTVALHLAGAMGKKLYGLFSHRYDPRWSAGRWYPTMTSIKQSSSGDWESVFGKVNI